MEEKRKNGIKGFFKIKLTRLDIISIISLMVFLILVLIPVWSPKDGCEVARPEYKCESFENVMIENCRYWGEFDCDTSSDISLTQIEWYIKNLCELQNREHNTGLECSNLMRACNQIAGEQVCPFGV